MTILLLKMRLKNSFFSAAIIKQGVNGLLKNKLFFLPAIIFIFFITAGSCAAQQITKGIQANTSIEGVKNKLGIMSSQKANLSLQQQKLSTDLLELTSADVLTGIQSREDLIKKMQSLKQFRYYTSVREGIKQTDEQVYVYIHLASNAATSIIEPYVQEVTDRDEQNHLAVAWVSVTKLKILTGLDAVSFIRTVLPPYLNTGSVTSEGDAIHRADQVRAQYGKNGSGVKVGIISDGVDHWTSARDKGDLPSNLNVLSNMQGGDEGTAMLEIVHDLAPGAELYFHDCSDNVVGFNNAVDELVSNGCEIICDDISWIAEPFFEDGVVASHMASVIRNNNITYISSAGNSALRHYQGVYYNDGYNCNNKPLYVDIPPGGNIIIVLEWNDKFGSSGNDYDLYLGDLASQEIIAWSENTQNGNDDPLEVIGGVNNGDSTIEGVFLVSNYRGLAASKTLEIYIYPGNGTLVYQDSLTSRDSIFGQTAIPDVISVGAIDVPDQNQIAVYSSQGPVTISYPASETRKKPDLCGMAGIRITGAGGFSNPFYGTSAAAPHIAAIAALIMEQYPDKSSSEIRNILTSLSIDLGASGYDYVYGYGRADALNAFPKVNLPTVQTSAATNITFNSATLNGSITNTGGQNCDQRKFQYRVKGAANWTDAGLQNGSFGAEAFNYSLTGLGSGQTYEFKAMAHNAVGWAEGSVLDFTLQQLDVTPPIISVFTINDGAEATNDTAVTLSIQAADEKDEQSKLLVSFSNDSVNWTKWESYNAVKEWELINKEGIQTVFIKVKDLSGNIAAGQETILLDLTRPEIVENDPQVGTVDVSVDISFIITFGENIQEGNSYNSISLRDSQNSEIELIKSLDNRTLVLEPVNILDYGCSYILNIPAFAVKDAAGNNFVEGLKINFVTGPEPGTGGIITGTVYLDGLAEGKYKAISIEAYNAQGSLVSTLSAQSSDLFVMTGLPPAQYNLRFKSENYLAKRKTGINVYDGSTAKIGNVYLRAGDINGDGRISLLDLVQFANSYNTAEGQIGYKQNCDLNGDDIVNIGDLGLLLSNYDFISN